MFDLITLVPLLPLIGFLILGLLGKYIKSEAAVGTIASAMVGGSFIISLVIFFTLLGSHLEKPVIVPVYQWIQAGNFNISVSYQVDQLSILFSLIITGIGFLIHVYSIGYMHGDRSFYRFFTYLNLFIFMMLNLVLASNFLLTFLGWEGVGLCSYLLIGFWYERKFEGVGITYTGDAGNKAFIVNRIGDFGFIIAMFIIFITFGTLDYQSVMDQAFAGSNIFYGTGVITAITLLLFLGCTGKSAQIPLAVWLPDAMAGPTPVSALIHAATMVTAGIFLIARTSVLFSLSPVAMTVVAVVGIATAFFAASIGLVQNDIKKVLAYSTVSQLGFMFAALGVGAFATGVFHVMTHAFFKGLLFLGAGAVIHGMHDEQNIKHMGGLKKYMPITYFTFLIATLAISGIPLFAGFFSKDEILWKSYEYGGFINWIILVTAAFFTAFYMFRLLYLTFFGKERFDHNHVHPHEAPYTMTVPLMVLALLSALGGFLGVPYSLGGFLSAHPNLLDNWLDPVFAQSREILKLAETNEVHMIEYILMAASVVIALIAVYLANRLYSKGDLDKATSIASGVRPVHKLLLNKYYLDEIYFALIINPFLWFSRNFLWKFFDAKIIDGIVNGAAIVTMKAGDYARRIQSGIAQNYAVVMMGGIIIIIAWLLFAV